MQSTPYYFFFSGGFGARYTGAAKEKAKGETGGAMLPKPKPPTPPKML